MKDLNNFAKNSTERIAEIINIFHSMELFNIKKSLSNDTFNANISFQLQYVSETIDLLISNLPRANKTYDNKNNDLYIYIDKSKTLVINIITKEYKYI